MSVKPQWERSAALLVETLDLLVDRLEQTDGPALATRGWRSFLLALDDAQLDVLEGGGAWPGATPDTLRALLEEARAVCALPVLDGESPGPVARRHESPRKHAQVDAFARILSPFAARAARVVDVGSGHGHLTRELAARIARPVVGLEQSAALVERARALAGDAVTFARTDVVRDGLSLTGEDCVVGLHACGELGDAIVAAAANAGAAVALIGCCLQKRRALARRSLAGGGLELPRGVLGLSNLTPRNVGVEASRSENLAARERRLALWRLLDDAGERVAFGAEIRGLNRRAAHHELAALVARAFAVRSLPPPPSRAVDQAAAWARAHHAELRRLQLPRTVLARVLEVHVLLDRGLHLEEHGYEVTVGTAFPAAVSARNLALVAARP